MRSILDLLADNFSDILVILAGFIAGRIVEGTISDLFNPPSLMDWRWPTFFLKLVLVPLFFFVNLIGFFSLLKLLFHFPGYMARFGEEVGEYAGSPVAGYMLSFGLLMSFLHIDLASGLSSKAASNYLVKVPLFSDLLSSLGGALLAFIIKIAVIVSVVITLGHLPWAFFSEMRSGRLAIAGGTYRALMWLAAATLMIVGLPAAYSFIVSTVAPLTSLIDALIDLIRGWVGI